MKGGEGTGGKHPIPGMTVPKWRTILVAHDDPRRCVFSSVQRQVAWLGVGLGSGLGSALSLTLTLTLTLT